MFHKGLQYIGLMFHVKHLYIVMEKCGCNVSRETFSNSVILSIYIGYIYI